MRLPEGLEFLERDTKTWTGPETAAAISLAIDLGIIELPSEGEPVYSGKDVLKIIEEMEKNESQEVDVS